MTIRLETHTHRSAVFKGVLYRGGRKTNNLSQSIPHTLTWSTDQKRKKNR